MSFAIHRKHSRDLEERNIANKIKELEVIGQSRPEQEVMTELQLAKERLEEIRKFKIEGIITRARAKWHEQGNGQQRIFSI